MAKDGRIAEARIHTPSRWEMADSSSFFPVPLDSAASRYQGTDYSDLDGDGNSDLQMSFDQDGEYVTYVWYWNTVRGEFMDTLAD